MIPFIIFAIIILSLYLKTPAGRGKIGELTIKFILGKTEPGEKYVINNLIIKGSDGKTSQIDHILINKNGIFVIETKNYSGKIFGDETQYKWTQTLNYGKVKNRFYNPVMQNDTHIRRIKEVTKTTLPIKSIVVFTQDNVKNIKSPRVFTIKEMKKYINRSQNYSLKIKDMEKVYKQLKSIKDFNLITPKKHIENIHNSLNR